MSGAIVIVIAIATATVTAAMMPEAVVPTSQGIIRATSHQAATKTITPRGGTSTSGQVEIIDRLQLKEKEPKLHLASKLLPLHPQADHPLRLHSVKTPRLQRRASKTANQSQMMDLRMALTRRKKLGSPLNQNQTPSVHLIVITLINKSLLMDIIIKIKEIKQVKIAKTNKRKMMGKSQFQRRSRKASPPIMLRSPQPRKRSS